MTIIFPPQESASTASSPRTTHYSMAVSRMLQCGFSRLLPFLVLLVLMLPTAVQAQFIYTTNNGTITITRYTGSGGAVAIPGTIEGLPVTSIGDYAFFSCISLTNLAIPDSVTNIGDYAFRECEKLTNLTIPNSVTRIGDGAFCYCVSLTSLAIPDSVTSIEEVAFYSCISLTSLAIPDSVTTIGEGAFYLCTKLTSVTIGTNITSIGAAAFARCTSLTSITIPDSVITIGQGAFNFCTKLTNVTIATNVTSIGRYAFNRCTSLTSVAIPNSVTNIGIEAFYSCTNLTSVTIGTNVTSIGEGAFASCTSLTGAFFQGNAPSVGLYVFGRTTIATVYYLPGTMGWGSTFAGRPTALWSAGSDRLQVRLTGRGTLLPNYSKAMLKVGRTYSMTAGGAKGHVFSKWLVSTNWSEGESVTTPKLTFVMQPGLTVEAVFVDVTRPTVTISSPVTGQRISNSLATVRGRASDNGQLAQVLCQVNNSNWVPALGTSNWTANLPLIVGTNRVRVVAEDSAGRFSATNTVIFLHIATSQFSLQTNGLGRVTRNFTGNTLEVDRSYTVTAAPATGYLFSNWVGTVTATNNPLRFVMQSNMVLQANFVPNPFIPLKGSYVGLFQPQPTETVSGTNAGALALTLSDRGTFSGSLRLAGKTHAFTSGFDVGRQASFKIARPGNTPLTVTLGFDTQTITGAVSATGWSAIAGAVRRATASSNALAGRYSMLIVGPHDSTNAPPGNGALAMTVTAPSSMTISGTMADGSAVTLATGHSVEGYWPFYAPLDGGRGVALGWMSCTIEPVARGLVWVKPPNSAARHYPGGFSETRDVALRRYLPPALKQTATSWKLSRLLIGGGNLPAPLEAEVLVTNNLIKSLSGSVSNLSLVITNSNGRFGGSFMHPVTRKATPLRGVLVQFLPWVSPAEQVAEGGGWFLGTNQGGYLWLEPKL